MIKENKVNGNLPPEEKEKLPTTPVHVPETVVPTVHAEELHSSPKRPYKKNASVEQQEKVAYAWEISGDPQFIYLLEAENGLWTHDRRHNPANNSVGVDWGLCGTNDYWHPQRVNDPRFLTDWRWQMRECLEMYRGGTKFYGNKERASQNFFFE